MTYVRIRFTRNSGPDSGLQNTKNGETDNVFMKYIIYYIL